jgi:hypothetical protein
MCTQSTSKSADDDTNLFQGKSDADLQEMGDLLPSVLEPLKRNGHLQTWIQLNEMISVRTFPFDNIAFSLFMYVCKLYGFENRGGSSFLRKGGGVHFSKKKSFFSLRVSRNGYSSLDSSKWSHK